MKKGRNKKDGQYAYVTDGSFISAYIPTEHYDTIAKIAARRDRSVSYIIREAIDLYIRTRQVTNPDEVGD